MSDSVIPNAVRNLLVPGPSAGKADFSTPLALRSEMTVSLTLNFTDLLTTDQPVNILLLGRVAMLGNYGRATLRSLRSNPHVFVYHRDW